MINSIANSMDRHRTYSMDSALDFTLVLPGQVAILKAIHTRLFPITYSESFYHKIFEDHSHQSFFIHNNQEYVGACSFYTRDDSAYIMTFGILSLYRRHGFGSQALQLLESILKCHLRVSRVYLHVQTNNLAAISFYTKNSYTYKHSVPNYYHCLRPSSAFLFEKILNIQ